MNEPHLFETFRVVLGVGESDAARDAVMKLFDVIVHQAEQNDPQAQEMATAETLAKLALFEGRAPLPWVALVHYLGQWHSEMLARCFALGYVDGWRYTANGRDAEIARESVAETIAADWQPKWGQLKRQFAAAMPSMEAAQAYEEALMAYYYYMQEKLYLSGVGVANRLRAAREEGDVPMD